MERREERGAGDGKKQGWIFRLRRGWSRIHPVDKSLLLILGGLLVQSAYSMFGGGGGQLTRDIDIAVRTASASIFGYFLSGSFRSCGQKPRRAIRHKLSSADLTADSKAEQTDAAECCCPQNWGRSGSDPAEEGAVPAPVCGLQVGVATGIGIFCLAALLLLRNAARWDPALAQSDAASAAVVQFRDFVSGCVGFLIGCPVRGTDRSTSS